MMQYDIIYMYTSDTYNSSYLYTIYLRCVSDLDLFLLGRVKLKVFHVMHRFVV